MRLEIPKLEHVVLLGGGRLLVQITSVCVSKNIPIKVVTSPRHAYENIDNDLTLQGFCKHNNIDFLITDDIGRRKLRFFYLICRRLYVCVLGRRGLSNLI